MPGKIPEMIKTAARW